MKINQLTFTRFLAAVSIVIFHCQANMFPFNQPVLKTIFSNANIGVSYFFILSGFVMIIAYGKSKSTKIVPKSYYLNRVARIYPIYLFALVLTIIVRLGNVNNIHFMDLLLQIFALQAWYTPSALNLNYPGWSLSVEALFYLAFPLLFNYFYRKYSLRLIIIAVVSMWLITQIIVNYLFLSPFYQSYSPISHNFLLYFPLFHLNQFMVGNMLGYFYLEYSKKQRNFDWLIILFSALLFLFLFFKKLLNYEDGLTAIIFGPLILLLALNNGKIAHALSNKYLVILGEASYSLYIIQVPIKSMCYFIFLKLHIININSMFYIYLIVLIAISILSYYFIEIPAKNWIKSFQNNIVRKRKLVLKDDSVNF